MKTFFDAVLGFVAAYIIVQILLALLDRAETPTLFVVLPIEKMPEPKPN
jgi:hypothetical protein